MKLDMSIGIQKHVYYIYIYKVEICFVQTHTIFFFTHYVELVMGTGLGPRKNTTLGCKENGQM